MLLLLLILGFLGAATSDDHDCSWAVDLVEKADMQQRAETLLPGGKYFLRIRVQCGGKVGHAVTLGARIEYLRHFSNFDALSGYILTPSFRLVESSRSRVNFACTLSW